jgi:hypothetical protein
MCIRVPWLGGRECSLACDDVFGLATVEVYSTQYVHCTAEFGPNFQGFRVTGLDVESGGCEAFLVMARNGK